MLNSTLFWGPFGSDSLSRPAAEKSGVEWLPAEFAKFYRLFSNSCGQMEPRYSELRDAIAELVRINPVPTILIDMTTFTVAMVNTAASTFLGYSEAEMVGQSITNFVPLED